MEVISFFTDIYTIRLRQEKLFVSCSEAHMWKLENLLQSNILHEPEPEPSSIEYQIYTAGKGGSMTEMVSPSGLLKMGEDYYNRNFKVDGHVHESIVYIRDIKNIEFVALLFEEWCESLTNKEEKNPVLICSYDPREQFWKLGFDDSNTTKNNVLRLRNYPRDTDESNSERWRKYADEVGASNNLLVYEQKNKRIFLVNVTEDKDVESIREKLKHNSDNIKALIAMNEDIFLNKELDIFGLVIAPEYTPDEQSFDRKLHRLIISKEELNKESFNSKLKENIAETRHTSRKEDKDGDVIFDGLCGKILVFLATVDYQHMPTLGEATSMQVDTRSVILNKQQRKVYYSKAKHLIITGQYGSGKSLIGIMRLAKIAKTLKKEAVIYYISYDSRSLLDKHVENEKRNIQLDGRHIRVKSRLEIMPDEYPLSYILRKLIENHPSEDVHVVVDEYNGEDLSKDEAEDLKTVLATDNMKNSNIVIIPQTMENHRTLNTIADEKYQYEYTGIWERFELHSTMRTTKQINDLMIAAQKVTSAMPNTYHFNDVGTDHLMVPYIVRNDTLLDPQIDEALKHCKPGNQEGIHDSLETEYNYTGDGKVGHSIESQKPCLYDVPFIYNNSPIALAEILKECLPESSGKLIVFFD